MSINATLNYLLTRRAEQIIGFAGQVTTASTYLAGPGGQAGDGLPLPKAARLTRLDCWDGLTLFSGTGDVQASIGDRLSVYAFYNGVSFDVKLRLNGVDTVLAALGAQTNATLMVTLHLTLV